MSDGKPHRKKVKHSAGESRTGVRSLRQSRTTGVSILLFFVNHVAVFQSGWHDKMFFQLIQNA
jgi:hypothetical protein